MTHLVHPKVTVLMPVYNGEQYLREAIDSILEQTFKDFEFLIINDGSTDRSREIVESYYDPRIRLVHNESNIGLIATLNKGLELARGEYIARMDSDDISYSERLEIQVNFMDFHKQIIACGTWAKFINTEGEIVHYGRSPAGKKMENLFWIPSPIIHPTVMIKRQPLGQLRYNDYQYSEDYDFFLNLKAKGKIDNISEYLLSYRQHDKNITSRHRIIQLKNSYDVFTKHIKADFISFDAFLSLILYEFTLNPLIRFYISKRLAVKINKSYFPFFFSNDIQYVKLWLRKKIRIAW